PSHGSALTWHVRVKIALDIARLQCKVNSFWIQISDFGLAVTVGNHNKGGIKLSGTVGYVAPEYLLDGI
ncbi:hypothetical protein BHE74_00019471, partial [Ensete ventricosum]